MKYQIALLILFVTFLLINGEISRSVSQPLFVSPLPQGSFLFSQAALSKTPQTTKKNNSEKEHKGPLSTLAADTDIHPPAGFDKRTESHGMYDKRILTAGQTRQLVGMSFATINFGVMLLKFEELMAASLGIVRVLFRPKPQMSIPYWEFLG